MSQARLLQIVASSCIALLLAILIVLDGFLVWPQLAKLYLPGLFVATALYCIIFFLGSLLQLAYALKEWESWRSKMAVIALLCAVVTLAAAIARFCIYSYATGGVLLAVCFMEIGFYKGVDWREGLRWRATLTPKTTPYEQV